MGQTEQDDDRNPLVIGIETEMIEECDDNRNYFLLTVKGQKVGRVHRRQLST